MKLIRPALAALAACVIVFMCGCAEADYASAAALEPYSADPDEAGGDDEPAERAYILNKSTKMIHLHDCSYVARINDKNKVVCDDIDEAIAEGYTWCSRCDPEK